MSIEIITREDLMVFKFELLQDLQTLLENKKQQSAKPWMKSRDVMKLLQISSGTLQNYRINGLIKFTRIGKTLYYAADDIETFLKQNKSC